MVGREKRASYEKPLCSLRGAPQRLAVLRHLYPPGSTIYLAESRARVKLRIDSSRRTYASEKWVAGICFHQRRYNPNAMIGPKSLAKVWIAASILLLIETS